MTLQVGYAQEVITPSLERPVFLAGFGQDRVAKSVHDDLFVRSLAIRDGVSILFLISLDLIGFFRPDVMEIKTRIHEVFPDADIVISSTHTHHGPDTLGLWGPNTSTSGVDPMYLKNLKDIIARTMLASVSNVSDCDEIKVASIRISGMIKNARDPGLVDDELVVFQFTFLNKPLITVFNFACHPEVLWESNPQITSDYPGYLRSEVEKATGLPCIFFPGALGGMLTPDVKDHSFEEAEYMGKSLAFSGLLALDRPNLRIHSPEIRTDAAVIKSKLTNILYKLAFMRKLLPDARDSKGCITSEVNLIRIGDLWITTVPGELLPKLGLTIKHEMVQAGAKIAGIIGLANDELGYILPREDFRYPLNPFKPGKHYEETNSISKDIGPRVVEGIRSLL